jgi:hypothetical protein
MDVVACTQECHGFVLFTQETTSSVSYFTKRNMRFQRVSSKKWTTTFPMN